MLIPNPNLHRLTLYLTKYVMNGSKNHLRCGIQDLKHFHMTIAVI